VRYVETSFHLGIVEFVSFTGREIIAAIRAAVPPGVEVRIFAGMLRSNYAGPEQAVTDDTVNWDELDGVDKQRFRTRAYRILDSTRLAAIARKWQDHQVSRG